jgi:hypothetical protein
MFEDGLSKEWCGCARDVPSCLSIDQLAEALLLPLGKARTNTLEFLF